MTTFNRRWDGLALLTLIAIFAITLVLYPRLPDPMPTHWNAAGQADDFSSRLVGAWLLPGMLVGIYLLILLIPEIDPLRANVARFRDTYSLVRFGIVAFMGLIHLLILWTVIRDGGNQINTGLLFAAIGGLFIVLGNYMPRVRPNWFMGIRTPWTLSSERVWKRTHRLAGRTMMLAGVAMLAGPFLPARWTLPLILGAAFVGTLFPAVYSFWLYRQEELAGAQGGVGTDG